MKTQDWQIKSRSDHCEACGHPFEHNEELSARLIFSEAGYQREDFCAGCWQEREAEGGYMSAWRSQFKKPPPPKPEAVRRETAETLLRKLLEEEDPANCNTIYILTVMLERRRILVEKEVTRNEAREIIRIYEHKKTGEAFVIRDPELKLADLEHVQEEVVGRLGLGERQEVEAREAPPFDLLVLGGLLLDGSGREPVQADVAVRDGRIAEIGTLAGRSAGRVIQADGCYVAPGFIDVHSHSDAYLLLEPSAASKVHQGITTEVVGQCGASAAPLMGDYKMPSDWREFAYPGKWSSLKEYAALLAQVRPSVNVVALTGHNTLRAGVMGYAARPASKRELDLMAGLLRECLEAGSAGLSVGLLYPPGKHAGPEEMLELARIVAEYDGVYATHVRNEGERLLEALDEALEVARATGVRLQISHLKTGNQKSWPLMDQAFGKIEAAREAGLRVFSDRYPYTAGCTDLDVLLPDWVFAEGPVQELAWLADADARKRIQAELEASRPEESWQNVRIGSTWHDDTARFRGRPILEAAAEMDLPPAGALIEILLKDRLKTGGFFFGMSGENMYRVLSRPWVMVGSDASLRAPNGPLGQDHPHPRAYGTFPRCLRAALDGKIAGLAETVRKMTSLPAEQFGLADRGRIQLGWAADLTVFEPGIIDRATYEQPHAFSTGLRAVVVNGALALEQDAQTGERAGVFLPHGGGRA